MEKRYQVFVSSTFADLENERRQIMQTLMEMDCIPAGMELFPAMDEEQMQFIKRVIDDCDYYLLLIGGRYGSLTAEGVSYTEKEYDYALEKGIKVIAILHKNPDEISVAKTDRNPETAAKLSAFRARAATGRIVKFWESVSDLPGLVALSVMKTIKAHPSVGWVRGNAVANEDLLFQINELRKENETLRFNSVVVAPPLNMENLAFLEKNFFLSGYYRAEDDEYYPWEKNLTWKDIYWHISPYIDTGPTDGELKGLLEESFKTSFYPHAYSLVLHDQIYQGIGIQLRALKLAAFAEDSTKGPRRWTLTTSGEQLMFEIRTENNSLL